MVAGLLGAAWRPSGGKGTCRARRTTDCQPNVRGSARAILPPPAWPGLTAAPGMVGS